MVVSDKGETINKEVEIARLAILSLLAAIGLGSGSSAADLVVSATGLRSAAGDLRVAICEREHFLEPSCAFGASAPAAEGRVTIRDVPPGEYAVQAFHDENRNGKIDRNLLGRPTEGMAFSRDAPMRFGPPSYADAAVVIPPGGGRLTMTMRYFR
ncbi:DUF2141 domain-containing protein [Palleronia sp. LCG004]|uniref:DUF2141 domain-containing protein n=1 Tax=Palleronia sp. LCG004 TaxID=3079304 RepID=UPI002943F53C|nr:DUF2141 domain-containing protein [Palleronia sp. LCG004]WOI57746.1 DUF2141 domain-containing protein [Palleronia sp. LCG004]